MTEQVTAAKEAAAALMRKDPAGYALRSCWQCNPAHGHLTDVDLINCSDCGRWYYRGIDITA